MTRADARVVGVPSRGARALTADGLQGETLVLFRSETLVVRASVGRSDDICFVAFDPAVDNPSLERGSFGAAFFDAHGFDAVHVLSDRNGWYQDAALPDALAAVKRFTARYRRVIGYGSSMGGYAALRQSPAIGAHAVIAISPQYSLQPSSVPFETRWRWEHDRVTWLHERPGDRLPAVASATIFSDDRGHDGEHMAAIRRDLPGATLVGMPHAGHPASTMLVELGVMASTMVDIARETFDAPGLLAHLRRNRHRSGQYLFTLARRQPPWRLRLKARLAERAAVIAAEVGTDPTYHSYAGLVLECAGLDTQALAFHAAATRRPGHGICELRHADILCRTGRLSEALQATERARHLLPLLVEPHELCAALRAIDRAPVPALAALAGTPRFAKRPDLVRGLRVAERSPLLRTALARALGAWLGRRYLRTTVLAAGHALRQLAEADAAVR